MKKITLLFTLFTQLLVAQNYTEYATGSPTDITTIHQLCDCQMGGASENDEAMI